MTPEALDGSEIALLVCYEQPGKDDEWFVFFGQARLESEGLYFLGRRGSRLPLSDEQVARAREITKPSPPVFGSAAYLIPLTMGDLPEGTDASSYISTGLKITNSS